MRSCEGEGDLVELDGAVTITVQISSPREAEAERAEQCDYLELADLAAAVDVEQAVLGERLINAGNTNVLMVQDSTHSSFIYMNLTNYDHVFMPALVGHLIGVFL